MCALRLWALEKDTQVNLISYCTDERFPGSVVTSFWERSTLHHPDSRPSRKNTAFAELTIPLNSPSEVTNPQQPPVLLLSQKEHCFRTRLNQDRGQNHHQRRRPKVNKTTYSSTDLPDTEDTNAHEPPHEHTRMARQTSPRPQISEKKARYSRQLAQTGQSMLPLKPGHLSYAGVLGRNHYRSHSLRASPGENQNILATLMYW